MYWCLRKLWVQPAAPLEDLRCIITSSSTTIHLLDIVIDRTRTFCQEIVGAISKTRHLLLFLQRMAFSRGALMQTLHQLVISLLFPRLTWGSETLWTEAQHIPDNLGLTYNRFARLKPHFPVTPGLTRTCIALVSGH